MTTVAITGITGLAGGHVARALHAAGHGTIGISRGNSATPTAAERRIVPDLTRADELERAFTGCDTILHFADRADRKSYSEDNVGDAARVMTALRTAAASAGITRIVAFSSVYADPANGADDLYGRSKRGMEAVATASARGSPAIIFRLPPLYGVGARGAVRHIARATAKGWPLPFGLAKAPRRFLSLDALADLCVHLTNLDVATFEAATGRILVPVTLQAGSLAAVSRTIGGGRAHLLPVPGIDRLLGGRLAPGQLERDRDAVVDAIGWRAPEDLLA